MYSKFEEELPILDGPGNLRLGICAMGPVAATDEITSMQGLGVAGGGQQDRGFRPVSPAHTRGAHAVVATETLPYTAANGWMVQTRLEPGSSQFVEEKAGALHGAGAGHESRRHGEGRSGRPHQAVLVKGHRNHEY